MEHKPARGVQKARKGKRKKRQKLKEVMLKQEAKLPGQSQLEWMLQPFALPKFFAEYWEKKPLVVRRGEGHYTGKTFSMDALKDALGRQLLQYSRNIDITHYSRAGTRETLNRDGETVSKDEAMRLFHEEGCTMRILHPQEFCSELHEEYFGCVVGCNIYVTPPGAQGFAPHYDDVDVFILQLEGSKDWLLYHPIDEGQVLPETSSTNFEQEEIGKPFMEVTLRQGDVLYFPRGIIHQARTSSVHSMHATVSTMQKNAWGHLLRTAMDEAVTRLLASDVAFRRCLPLHSLAAMGHAPPHSLPRAQRQLVRSSFLATARQLALRVAEQVDDALFDSAADRTAQGLLYDCLPPARAGAKGKASALSLQSRIRLVSSTAGRLLASPSSLRLYYSTRNSRSYRDVPPQFLEFPLEADAALSQLFAAFPAGVPVASLELEFEEDRLAVAEALLAEGIVAVA